MTRDPDVTVVVPPHLSLVESQPSGTGFTPVASSCTVDGSTPAGSNPWLASGSAPHSAVQVADSSLTDAADSSTAAVVPVYSPVYSAVLQDVATNAADSSTDAVVPVYSVSYKTRKWLSYLEWEEVVASTQGSEPGESWKLMREEGAPTRTRPGPNHLGVWNVVEMYIDIWLSPLVVDADQFYYTGSALPLYVTSGVEVVSRSVVWSYET